MKPVQLLLLLMFTLQIVSCDFPMNNDEIVYQLQTNAALCKANSNYMESMLLALDIAETKKSNSNNRQYNANIWLPLVSKLLQETEQTNQQINSIKNKLLPLPSPESILSTSSISNTLLSKCNIMLNCNTIHNYTLQLINQSIERSNKIIYAQIDTLHLNDDEMKAIHSLLGKINTLSEPKHVNSKKIVALNKITLLQNQYLALQQKQLKWMTNKVSYISCGYWQARAMPLIFASANVIHPNQNFELYVGVGKFQVLNQPTYRINHKTYTDENGLVTVKERAPQQSGKYNIPVTIAYTQDDGTTISSDINFEYIVTNPSP